MAYKLHCYTDEASLAKAAAENWLETLSTRLKSPLGDKPYCVALSGGRIARNFFSEIARQAANQGELLTQVHFFWADERCVPPTDPESNYAVARQLLFEPLKIPEARIHRLRGEENEALALRDAVDNIRTWASAKTDKGTPLFDMIFLGMGEDGHVASLFPGETDEVMADPAIYRVVTAVKPPPRRMTLSYGVIISALDVWVLASGAGKRGALKESLAPAGKTPLARVIKQRELTNIFTDVVQ